MRRFEIVRSTTDTLTSHSGLALVGRALAQTRLDKDLGSIALRHGIAHADCVRSYVRLLSTGKSDFDAIENRREDCFFKRALCIDKVSSAPSLRQRFDEHHLGGGLDAGIGEIERYAIAFGWRWKWPRIRRADKFARPR